MRKVVNLLAPTSLTAAGGDTGANLDFSVPSWAVGAVFFINVSASGGTTPLTDFKLQYEDPQSSGTFEDVAGASITQISGTDIAVLTIDPRITAAANVAIAKALMSNMRGLVTIDHTTGNETYTISVTAEFYS